MIDTRTTGKAYFSPCFRYRYLLIREWEQKTKCCFIMLNPSTADADIDDPTIRRCMSFARREHCGGIAVLNLFAFRATLPGDMKAAEDPVGPENDGYLQMALEECKGPIIAAWGAHGSFRGRDKAVRQMFGDNLLCLGLTAAGQPRHPLYLKSSSPLRGF